MLSLLLLFLVAQLTRGRGPLLLVVLPRAWLAVGLAIDVDATRQGLSTTRAFEAALMIEFVVEFDDFSSQRTAATNTIRYSNRTSIRFRLARRFLHSPTRLLLRRGRLTLGRLAEEWLIRGLTLR